MLSEKNQSNTTDLMIPLVFSVISYETIDKYIGTKSRLVVM